MRGWKNSRLGVLAKRRNEMKSEIRNVSGEKSSREGEWGQRGLLQSAVKRQVSVFTLGLFLSFFASFFALFTVFLSYSCCPPSVFLSVCVPFSSGLCCQAIVSLAVFISFAGAHSLFYLLLSFMCRALFLSHYDQCGGRGRHVAHSTQSKSNTRGCADEDWFCMVLGVSHSD